MDQWNEQGGGGYFGENGAGTPATESKSKPAARQQFLCPVTIRQLLEAPEEGLRVGNNTATMVNLAGIVSRIDVSSTNIMFVLSDDTGNIECVDWLENEDAGPKTPPNITENSYYQVFGCIKSPQGRRRIMVFKTVAIEDFNDYTAFMAEVLSINRYAEKINFGGNATMESTTVIPTITSKSHFVEDSMSSFTPVQRAVLAAIKAVESQIGWARNDPALQNKFSSKAIGDALEFLVGEGHIYSTVDDDHFNST